jgi:hypothetical protein
MLQIILQLYETVKMRQSQFLSDIASTASLNYIDLSEGGTNAVVEFTASSCAVLENEGKVRIVSSLLLKHKGDYYLSDRRLYLTLPLATLT